MRKRLYLLCGILAMSVALIPFHKTVRRYAIGAYHIAKGRATVGDRLTELGEATRTRLKPHFEAQGVDYPPAHITFVGLKKERELELWAGSQKGDQRLICRYPVIGMSGQLGPKMLEGDHQVPEGVYEVESLNPNSMFYLSLRLNYPNSFDSRMAKAEQREFPGSDIFIHGGSASVGCLAMGDPAAEELFVLVADSGTDSVVVILSPVDFRETPDFDAPGNAPSWTPELYRTIRAALTELRHGSGAG